MPWDAKYRGTCALCGHAFQIGDSIDRVEGGGVAHDDCMELPEPRAEVCDKCWLEKPCGCDDNL